MMDRMTQTQPTDQTVDRSVSRLTPLRRWTFALPVLLVNLAGLVGQSMWFFGQITDPTRPLEHHHKVAIVTAVLFGVALESISVYLALQAHAALLADQASGGLRLGSYLVAAVVAGLNYSHFADDAVNATGLGVTFALLSLVSPWLWSIDSRSANRARLAAQGVVDPRGVKLSSGRKFWHPRRSIAVMRHAAWIGETNPAVAVADWERSQTGQTQTVEPIRAEVQIEPQTAPPVPQIEPRTEPLIEVEAEADQTETVTQTVTRTETRTVSVSRQERRAERLRERVQMVQTARPDWATAGLSYDDLRGILNVSGAEVIKPVYAILYRGETVESLLLSN